MTKERNKERKQIIILKCITENAVKMIGEVTILVKIDGIIFNMKFNLVNNNISIPECRNL